MKKYLNNFWVRFLACLLCAISLVGMLVYGGLFVGASMVSSKEDVNEAGKEIIATNYAAYVYDLYTKDEKDGIKKIEDFLKEKNFTCAIVEVSTSSEEKNVLEEKTVYSNLSDVQDWDYELEIEKNAYVRYNVESAWDALRMEPIVSNHAEMDVTSINGYVFDVQKGLFYYSTTSGKYFLADYVVVAGEDESCDFILRTQDGKKVYYNDYFEWTLDTTQYKDWEWVEINDEMLTLLEIPENVGSGSIAVTTINQEDIYTGEYHVEDVDIWYYPSEPKDSHIVRVNVNDVTNGKYPASDMFVEWDDIQENFYAGKGDYQKMCIICAVLFLFGFALLIYSANDDKEKMGFMEKSPLVIYTGCVVAVEILIFAVLWMLVEECFYGYSMLPFELWMTIAISTIFAMAFLLMIWIQNMIARIKTKTFLRYSEIYYGYKLVKWTWKKVTDPVIAVVRMLRENLPLVVKGVVVVWVLSIAEFFFCVLFYDYVGMLILGFAFGKIVQILVVVFVLLQMYKLQEASKRIAAGDLSEKINTSSMFWEFKKHGENINKVSDGISLAVEERMKSERFKTELITNVSHDIKTPLTSIINYVDLIKKEKIEDEKLTEYIDVLDRQSARLKKLIEDLMEASKASTGNLAVNIEDCDAGVLLTQLLGEFEEKLAANNLEVVVDKPEEPILIKVDGRHMWRVFDNLLNNACKYSLPGTRVYVSLTTNASNAVITFKNISKAPLNIPSDELMERFVRGDSSRNTEGSGLGLSIAQSLTELMGGTMKLDIDGDLFKVILQFGQIGK